MESLLKTLQGFGIGRVAAIGGAAAGALAILLAIMLRVGGQPMSLLYSNLDLKEAGQITASLDQANIKYELKGDGSTILVDRDKVASARLMLSGKGLPTSGSVGIRDLRQRPGARPDRLRPEPQRQAGGRRRGSWPAPSGRSRGCSRRGCC